jgi:hypothetical protein
MPGILSPFRRARQADRNAASRIYSAAALAAGNSAAGVAAL